MEDRKKEIMEVALKVPLFENMSPEEIEILISCFQMDARNLEKGEMAIMEGFPVNKIGILIKGELRAFKTDREGRSQLVSKVFPYQIFGDILSCTLGKPSPVTVEARSKSRVIFIDAGNIMSPCSNCHGCHSVFLSNLLKLVSRKYFEREYMIELLSEGSLRKRLCGYFLRQYEKSGREIFSINMNGTELSQYLAVNRSAMARELTRLKSEGILSFSGGKCSVLNAEKLRLIAK